MQCKPGTFGKLLLKDFPVFPRAFSILLVAVLLVSQVTKIYLKFNVFTLNTFRKLMFVKSDCLSAFVLSKIFCEIFK